MEKRPVYNADGTLNGYVKEVAVLEMEIRDTDGNPHRELLDLPVVNLGGKHDLFLGYDWLDRHNPLVDWRHREIAFGRCPAECGMHAHEYIPVRSLAEYVRGLEAGDYPADPRLQDHVRAFQTKATEIAMKADLSDVQAELPREY